ncbi:hypothetical protein E4U46_003014 [Claviceps purpurea]|nr:hypothetical protein E4U28_007337 [Claviceps purpurea]KAG6186944.1 hypothetical protein E4U27_008200 [Claviceps purpurea]KAG6212289.1 hypothetical protein E4U50_001960 [Claviceps purpurea]KAG6288789.1 hypothetical protein E4U46_003014 [Claviceps purpurea]
MVQIASLISAVIVAIAPAHAWRCTFGVDYCGATLTKYGYGKESIDHAASSFAVPPSESLKVLFACNYDGSITTIDICEKSCQDAGPGNSDYCIKS